MPAYLYRQSTLCNIQLPSRQQLTNAGKAPSRPSGTLISPNTSNCASCSVTSPRPSALQLPQQSVETADPWECVGEGPGEGPLFKHMRRARVMTVEQRSITAYIVLVHN